VISELKFNRRKYFVGLARYLFIGCANTRTCTKYIKINNYSPFEKYIISSIKFTEYICTNYFYKGEGTNCNFRKGILYFFFN
ncbi:hypothetical protein GE21DRAFT_1217906, partial [Neurospora crassa]